MDHWGSAQAAEHNFQPFGVYSFILAVPRGMKLDYTRLFKALCND